jgi:hypothetical protein
MTAVMPTTLEETEVRRDFRLPAEDEAFMEATELRWETIAEGAGDQMVRRLVIYGFQIPAGYNIAVADLFLRIEPLYPDTQIDMVYFHPALAKASGGAIGALSVEPFDEKQWQRWSRHRTGQNPWRPGLDSVETHLALVRTWLTRELR